MITQTLRLTPALKKTIDNIINKAHVQGLRAAFGAGTILIKHFSPLSPQEKTNERLVTSVNLASENYIKKELFEKHFPKFNFWGDETKKLVDNNSEFTFIVDSLEGRDNYANGNFDWVVSIALFYQNVPVVGIISPPYLRFFSPFSYLYSAVYQKGAYFGGLKMASWKEFKIPYRPFGEKAQFASTTKYLKAKNSNLTQILEGKAKPRVTGINPLNFVAVARGGYVGAAAYSEKFEDVAAPVLIASEAGVKIFRYLPGEDAVSWLRTDNIFNFTAITEKELKEKYTLVVAHPRNISTITNGLELYNPEGLI